MVLAAVRAVRQSPDGSNGLTAVLTFHRAIESIWWAKVASKLTPGKAGIYTTKAAHGWDKGSTEFGDVGQHVASLNTSKEWASRWH